MYCLDQKASVSCLAIFAFGFRYLRQHIVHLFIFHLRFYRCSFINKCYKCFKFAKMDLKILFKFLKKKKKNSHHTPRLILAHIIRSLSSSLCKIHKEEVARWAVQITLIYHCLFFVPLSLYTITRQRSKNTVQISRYLFRINYGSVTSWRINSYKCIKIYIFWCITSLCVHALSVFMRVRNIHVHI